MSFIEMFRLNDSDLEKSFFVTSANWECFTVANTFDSAASKGLETAFANEGLRLSLSPAIIVIDVTSFSLNFNDEYTKVYSTEMVLHDIGKHDLAKKFKKIIKSQI